MRVRVEFQQRQRFGGPAWARANPSAPRAAHQLAMLAIASLGLPSRQCAEPSSGASSGLITAARRLARSASAGTLLFRKASVNTLPSSCEAAVPRHQRAPASCSFAQPNAAHSQ
jgi:hypothetical protein